MFVHVKIITYSLVKLLGSSKGLSCVTKQERAVLPLYVVACYQQWFALINVNTTYTLCVLLGLLYVF